MEKRKVVSSKTTPETDWNRFIQKVEDQLSSLNRKMDILISKLPPSQSVAVKLPAAPLAPSKPMNVQPPALTQSPAQQDKKRHERPLYQAVCAECRKECEVPFKPSGERPVFCKECFAKRKKGLPAVSQSKPESALFEKTKETASNSSGVAPNAFAKTASPKRHITVVKKGVGKVTVSEIIAPRDAKKSPKKSGKETPDKSKKKFAKKK